MTKAILTESEYYELKELFRLINKLGIILDGIAPTENTHDIAKLILNKSGRGLEVLDIFK
jgi:hypothetical protein